MPTPSQPIRPATHTDQLYLIEKLKAGDRNAYDQLVRDHGGRMLAVARRILTCEADAVDAVQEAYIAAMRSIDRFEGRCSMSTWLHRIVVNECLMIRRTKSRKSAISLDDLQPRFASDGHHQQPITDWSAAAPEQLAREETRVQVRECVDRLPEEYRRIVVLRDIEGFDTQTTAEMLGINVTLAKTRLHRARTALRELLSQIIRP